MTAGFTPASTAAHARLAPALCRRLGQHFVNNLWAIASTLPFYPVKIVGKEKLPPGGMGAVYVANHQSFMVSCSRLRHESTRCSGGGLTLSPPHLRICCLLCVAAATVGGPALPPARLQDIFSLFHLQRPFKFISKKEIFLIPIIGWSMFLTGHVRLDRVDRRSQLDCLKTCIELLGKVGTARQRPRPRHAVCGWLPAQRPGVPSHGAAAAPAFATAGQQRPRLPAPARPLTCRLPCCTCRGAACCSFQRAPAPTTW